MTPKVENNPHQGLLHIQICNMLLLVTVRGGYTLVTQIWHVFFNFSLKLENIVPLEEDESI